MALIPKMEESEKKIHRLVDKKWKEAEEERLRKVNELVDKRLKEAEEERKKRDETQVDEKAKHTASRIVKAIDLIKGEREENVPGNPSPDIKVNAAVVEHKEHKDDVLCPTCSQGHVHKLEQGGKSYELVCNDGKCKMEWIMIPKNPDYKCLTCGGPLKKPEEGGVNLENCLYCNTKSKAVRFDWSKQLAFAKMQKPTK
jgi:hypothetical protein